MEARKISLDDFVLFGGGANGESYDCKYDKDLMLKLYFPGKITQPLDEMKMARKVFETGIPTPEPGEYVVTEDGRYGILFRRIAGKKSFSRATADEPERLEEFAATFAHMCRELHATKVDTTQFENVKDRYYRLLGENPFFSPVEKEKLSKFIADTPDEDTAVHGDLQFSNGIFTPDGMKYFIDLGDFCWGNHLFDVAMVYLSCCLSSEEFILPTFHMPKSLSVKFWEAFVPEYFGKGVSPKEAEALIGPYAGLKTLIIERDTRCPMPEFREALKPILR